MKMKSWIIVAIIVLCIIAVILCMILKGTSSNSPTDSDNTNSTSLNKEKEESYVPDYAGSGKVYGFDSFERANSEYLIIDGATKEDFEDYKKLLKKNDFKCVYENIANENLFETWTDEKTILTLSHISYVDPATSDFKTESLGDVKYMSITKESVEDSALPVREADIKKVTEVQLTAVGTQCGYVLRLADGRFVIFDGGMPDQTRKIYDVLQSQNVLEGEPVIAAWFLTHAHVDHIGALLEFIGRYYDRIEIQTFVHNLPAYDIYNMMNTAEKNPQKESDALYEKSILYYEKVKAFYPNANITVAHAGQRFEYGDIDIDVLFTTENIFKKQMFDTNMSSVIYSVKGDGGRMIILGDAQDIQCPLLHAIYGDELKCDLVQVAHHGYNGGNAEMYASMNAKYAIWPNSYETIIGRSLHIPSQYPRNKFNYKSVMYNFIPSINKETIILNENMTSDDLLKYHVQLTDDIQN